MVSRGKGGEGVPHPRRGVGRKRVERLGWGCGGRQERRERRGKGWVEEVWEMEEKEERKG
jgi:hypothetical protein